MTHSVPDMSDLDQRDRPGMSVLEMKAEDIDRAAHRATSIREAKAAAEAFPSLVADILEVFRGVYPLHVIATIAFWGLNHAGGPQGFSMTGMIKGVEQHHVELLQALLLTLDRSEWGEEPASSQQIQRAIDAVIALAKAFHRRRLIHLEECADDLERLTVIGLQELMRDYTQMVRNWSTHSEMLNIVRAVHEPLDAALAAHHGFSASDLIDVADSLVDIHQERTGGHFALLKDVFRARTTKAIVHGFFSRFEGVEGDPDEFLASFPKRIPLRDLKMILRCHADRWLFTYMCVEPAILAERIGKPVATVAKVFHALGMRPGSLRESDPEHLFLANPLWERPVLQVGDEFIFFAPQGIVSFLPTILRGLVKQASLAKKLEKRRTSYLEEELACIVGQALPSATLRSNQKWKWQGVEYETDLIAVLDRVVLIGEAKSGVLTAGALRGGPRSVRDHVEELLVNPAMQSGRLRDILLAASSGDIAAVEVVTGLDLGIDPARIEEVLRLSVTLDDFSALSSAQADLRRAGWLPVETILPPTMQLAELRTVAHILDDPAYFLNYLSSRAAIQGGNSVFAFELDFLGAYLESGLDLPEIVAGTHKGVFRNMSLAIDRYYMSRETGYEPEKPEPLMDPYIKEVLARLRDLATPGWMVKSLALLDAIPPGSCNGLAEVLDDLAEEVSFNWEDPEHRGAIALSGPGCRAVAMFHVFPQALGEGLHEELILLAEDALNGAVADRCVVVARMLERWNIPFQTTAMLRMSEETRSPAKRRPTRATNDECKDVGSGEA